ncbi:MAG: histidine phosphatase family protein [Herpetosiphon sp.]|nr:histidine phosphatase family protein [Herpetosiphon sp.]
MTIRTLLLIRHGHYRNIHPTGHEPDGHLTERGQEQASLVAERLHDYQLRAIFHSNTIRTRETAAPLIAKHPKALIKEVPLLREAWAGMPDEPLLPDAIRAQLAAHPKQLADGLQRAKKIIERFFVPINHDCTDVLVIHGNLISALVTQVVRAPWGAWLNAETRHAAISEIEIHPNGMKKLISHGDVGHLPRALYSF